MTLAFQAFSSRSHLAFVTIDQIMEPYGAMNGSESTIGNTEPQPRSSLPALVGELFLDWHVRAFTVFENEKH